MGRSNKGVVLTENEKEIILQLRKMSKKEQDGELRRKQDGTYKLYAKLMNLLVE